MAARLASFIRSSVASSLNSSKNILSRQRKMAVFLSPARASSTAGSGDEQEILLEESNHTRKIILNRPRPLNALSYWMLEQLKEIYEQSEEDKQVHLLIIKGSGRAFCAGGDVLSAYHVGNAGRYDQSKQYFFVEYIVNYILGTYRKSHVALLDGIVMGGGAGISIHGNFRVATEKTMFAMPETALGLHPDVGASYFLSRLPGYLGEYVGLTGVRLDGAELLAVGLATHFVPSERLLMLEESLKGLKTGDPKVLSSAIDKFSEKVKPKEGSPLYRLGAIDRCFSKSGMEEILDGLDLEGKDSTDEWYEVTSSTLRKASPVSLKITLRSIREGRHQSLRECLTREYRMTVQCLLRKVSNDFYEGCRAILVDKDRNPKWNPARLDLVTPAMVDHYFAALGEDGNELQLPDRHHEQQSIKGHAKL